MPKLRAWTLLSRITRPLTRGAAWAIVAVMALAVLRSLDPAPVSQLRDTAFDLYQLARPRVIDDRKVIIVDVDEQSLRELGQWPWPRTLVADLVTRLADAGAAAIALDIVLAEPDRLSPHRLGAALAPYGATALSLPGALPDSDAVLAKAITGRRVVLGQVALAAPAAATPSAAPSTSIASIGGDPAVHALRFPALLANLPQLEAAAAGRGVVTVRPERDGVIRRVPLIVSAAGRIAPSLAIEAIRVATGGQTVLVKQDDAGIRSVVLAGVEVPTDQQGQLWPHFSRHDDAAFVSAADVLAGRAGPDRIGGRIVLVGTSAAGLFDLRSTPVERVIPGVEIHAQVIEGILDGSILVRPNYAIGAEIVLALVASGIVIVAVPLLGALSTLLIGAACAAALAGLSWWLFAAHDVLLDVTYPLASTATAFALLTFRNYFQEEARRTTIRNVFRQYLAPDLVERLVQAPDRVVLGGETRPMTVLFTDFRGFTSLAEAFKDNPQGLTELMNRLLTPMSHAILDQRGTIDKYIGDAIMAFWNAPLDDADHAAHGCQAALDVLAALAALVDDDRVRTLLGTAGGLPEIGIGIATGVNVVGNMGSDVRFDYTVLGDSVNVASRLQGLTRDYGLKVLVSAAVARACAGRFAFLEIDRVALKGRTEPETVYALLGDAALAQTAELATLQTAFAQMLDLARSGDVHGARSALQDARRAATAPALGPLFAHWESRLAARDG